MENEAQNTDNKAPDSDVTRQPHHRAEPGEKPDAKVVQNAEEAEEHIAEHDAESGADAGATSEDVRHGFTQDSGYAQSGGAKKEPAKPG